MKKGGVVAGKLIGENDDRSAPGGDSRLAPTFERDPKESETASVRLKIRAVQTSRHRCKTPVPGTSSVPSGSRRAIACLRKTVDI